MLGAAAAEEEEVRAACKAADDLVDCRSERGAQIRRQELSALNTAIGSRAVLVGSTRTVADFATWAAACHVLSLVSYADYQDCHDLIRYLDATQHARGMDASARRPLILDASVQVAH